MKCPQEAVLPIEHLVEANHEGIALADSNGVTIGDELDGTDDTTAGNRRLCLHFDSVVDPDNFHVLLKQHHLVDLLEVVDFFNLAIMR